jgi:Na+/proline symporter
VLAGAVLVIIIVFMAVTSSGASEMVAVSSLFTFDVYRRYIDPKVSLKPYQLILFLSPDGKWAGPSHPASLHAATA